MSKLDQDLQSIDLPVWALFKNLVFEEFEGYSPRPYSGNAEIYDYEWVNTAYNYQELEKLIPEPEKPKEPEDKELLRAFKKRFSFGRIDDDDPSNYEIRKTFIEFITSYDQWTESYNDNQAFGETYTLLLICPQDQEAVKEHIKHEMKYYDIRDLKEDKYEDVSTLELSRLLKDKYIERLHFLPILKAETAKEWGYRLKRDIERWFDGLDELDRVNYSKFVLSEAHQILDGVTIQEAEDKDKGAIKDLIDGHNEDFHIRPPHSLSSNEISHLINETGYQFLLAHYGDEVVGFLGYQPMFMALEGKAFYVDRIYLDPVYRGRHIGKQLWDTMIEKAKNDDQVKGVWWLADLMYFWGPLDDFFKAVAPDAEESDDRTSWVWV